MTLDVLVVGEALIDLYCLDAGVPRRMDEAGTLARFLGGAPANFTVGCARLGLQTALVTRVGQDPMGRYLLRLLRDEGVDTERVRSAVGAKTGMSLVSVHGGERSFDFYGAPSADTQLDPSDIGERIDARALHFGSNTLVVDPGLATTKRAIAMAKRDGVTVSCDLNVRRYRWSSEAVMREQLDFATRAADWLKVSDDEIAFVSKEKDYDAVAKDLLSRGPSLVALTLGKDGARLYTKEEQRVLPTLAERIVDTTGAGDAFWAGCVAVFLRAQAINGATLEAALRRGSENAAAVIAQVGAVTGALKSSPAGALRP
ncbi:MAG: carbohydrate kinase [Deltaproteobacteria bacterium]|nr:carbohydrate kinase [Deltaproteobacteria bacterium]